MDIPTKSASSALTEVVSVSREKRVCFFNVFKSDSKSSFVTIVFLSFVREFACFGCIAENNPSCCWPDAAGGFSVSGCCVVSSFCSTGSAFCFGAAVPSFKLIKSISFSSIICCFFISAQSIFSGFDAREQTLKGFRISGRFFKKLKNWTWVKKSLTLSMSGMSSFVFSKSKFISTSQFIVAR